MIRVNVTGAPPLPAYSVLSPTVLNELSQGLAADDRWKQIGSMLGKLN